MTLRPLSTHSLGELDQTGAESAEHLPARMGPIEL